MKQMTANIFLSFVLIFVAAGCYIKEGDKAPATQAQPVVPVPVVPVVPAPAPAPAQPPIIINNDDDGRPGYRRPYYPPHHHHHHRPPFSLEIEINKGKGGDHHHREDHKK